MKKSPLFLLLLLPILLLSIGLYNYRITHRHFTQAVHSHHEAVAELAAEVLREKFDRLIDLGVSLATRKRFQELIKEGDWQGAIKVLDMISGDFPYVEQLFLTDRQGIEKAALPALSGNIGKDHTFHDWYQGVSRNWKPYISEIHIPTSRPGHKWLSAAVPIRSQSGEILGILILEVRIEILLNWARKIEVGESGSLYFIDHKGHLITHSEFSSQGEIVDFSSSPVFLQLQRGEKGVQVLYDSIDQQEKLYAYKRVPGYGWGVVMTQPTREAFVLRDQHLRFLVGHHLFSFLASLVLVLAVFKMFKTEQRILVAERRIASIVEASNDAVIGKDLNGVILNWNKGAEKLYGYSAEEAVGKSISILFPPDHSGELPKILEKIKKGEQLEHYETLRIRKNGTQVQASLTISPIKDGQGHVVGALVIARDITAEKELERQREGYAKTLQQSNNELARRQRIMASLLEDLQSAKEKLQRQQTDLQVANEQLKKLNQLKDEFVANVNHELRTPLTVIKEGVSLLLDEVLGSINAEQRDFLLTMDQSIDRLKLLINDILDLSKIEAGRFPLFRRRVALKSLVETTVTSYRPIAGHRKLSIQIASLPDVFVDPNRILQVLGNLFSNAVKFTKEDGAVTLSAWEEGGKIIVSVQDDGTGIAKEDLAKLFQKFSQVGSPSAMRKGTGLGLVLCKELVELHKGSISIASEPGKGSTFSFSLPVYAPALALEETFNELIDAIKSGSRKEAGLIAVDCSPLLNSKAKTGNPAACLRETSDFVRTQIHQTDAVLPLEPQWVVVLAAVDRHGIQAIIRRLEKAFKDRGTALDLGSAWYPADAPNVHDLLTQAVSSLKITEH